MSNPRRNLELKARLRNPAAARKLAETLADRPVELQTQCDTYFHCRRGRLKLREIDGRGGQLICYERADRAEPKASDYRLVEVGACRGLGEALAAALGVRAVVRKHRRIYWHRNVRIHLDEVESLGDYLEFEAVCADSADETVSRRLVDELTTRFGLMPDDLRCGSYSDMLAALDGG
ncbi:MAG TPA: class IV adenylate cyclase [Pirellulales bacterium]|nr:class IV adenylate cyclase [Pirellulales bacterium]